MILDNCANGEIYNLIIRGGNRGGLDGLDIFSNNIHVHDVEVSNKDECVTVKSPSHNILIENVFCNWSGGCAMGSLGAGVGKSPLKSSFMPMPYTKVLEFHKVKIVFLTG